MKPETRNDKIIWVTEWDSTGSACPHGIGIPYRWVNETSNDEDSSEPECGSYDCAKCAQAREKVIDAMRRQDWDSADYWRTQTGYGV